MSTSGSDAPTTGLNSGGSGRPSGDGAPPSGTIAYAKIYPGIGIARVGNSPDQYFLGPEVPGRPVDADGRFKDRQGRMKRQAARFRVYGFDSDGQVLQELTSADADITWTVHLANSKASWSEFRGAAAEATGSPLPLRNAHVQNTAENPAARDELVIDPGPRSVAGAGRPTGSTLADSRPCQSSSVNFAPTKPDACSCSGDSASQSR